ncbi:receptor like protein 28-like [Gossypium arboreum]|uniref:receptor like protein 28-like n=1 Tax=Gossypium arboreum TaxID=29729 RepID=UPI0022F16BB9|nr:receptor like protein 28-like [Gossypium arboreum]
MASYLFLCLFLFFPHLYASSSRSHSCSSLIQFKNSFSITKYVSWHCDDIAGLKSYPKTYSWEEGTDCCSWDGVTCDHLNAHVIALDLSCSWLYGNFPSNTTLVLLPHLQKLNLAYNDFNLSKIPSEFGRFESLVYLNLSHTNFVGEVPSQVSPLSKLVSLDLSSWNYDSEQFTIDQHALEGLVHNLTEVRHLFLNRINMSSINPHVFMNLSSSLRSLSLAYCDLQGKFQKHIFDLPNLNFLNLRGNQLTGQIPRSLGNLLQLTHLDLSDNQLSGQIPLSIPNLTQLEFLDIAQNSLEGSIPDEVAAFPNLKYLYLYDNLLNGTLPSWLYTAPSLKVVELSQNQFSGHIKEFQSKSLEYLDIANNKLQGPLPSSISQLLNLTDLILSSNNLNGVIELSMFSNLSNLNYLGLSYNSLSLTSNSISSVNHILPNLTGLFFSSCNLSEFPHFLKGLKSLGSLDLSYNRIEGKIPQWMQEVGNDSLTYLNVSHNSLTEVKQFSWKNIAVLDLSSNLIRGNLPIPASSINTFLISNNSFNGEVSSLICNVTSLQILDLSHNNLSGTIPRCLGNLSDSLEFLNLKKNKFYGTIPPTFAKGCQLSNLNLNGNLLEGPLTPSILNCNGLEVLDLGNNKINDTFPHWLGSLPQLQVLVLKSNHMHGSLCVNSSKSSPVFSKIQIFDLSSNYFSGPLPVRYINSFKAIINLETIGSTVSYMGVYVQGGSAFYTYSIGIVLKGRDVDLVKIFTMWMIIDLSNNQFEGEIPKVIGKLNLLKGLNLSHNNLNGGIPTSIGNLTSLEWLDLSSNRLSGTIPNRLADLPFLSSLNVSENQLHGQIPQGKQFNTFGNDSYEGNKGLCGFPVSKGCKIIEPAPPNVLEKDGSKSNIACGWKVVLIGYGCGVVFGMAMGYVVFQTGKLRWLVNLVENQHEKKRRRKSKKGNRNNRRRRI